MRHVPDSITGLKGASGRRRLLAVTAAALVSALFLAPAHAEDGLEVSGDVAVELLDALGYDADDPATAQPKIQPSVTVAVSDAWSVVAQAVIEPVRSEAEIERRDPSALGMMMNDLRLRFADGRFHAEAGKLEPRFGIAWERTPSAYPQEYRIGQRMGVSAGLDLGDGGPGSVTVSASSFFLDAAVLDRSVLSGHKSDDESELPTYNAVLLALDGKGLPGRDEAGYHFSVMHQAARDATRVDEIAVAFGLHTRFDLGNDVGFVPVAEYVRHRNYDGIADQDRAYFTFAGQLDWQGLNLAVAWSGRDTALQDAEDSSDARFRVMGRYSFDCGISLELGWRAADEAAAVERTLDARASYSLIF